MSSMIRFPDDSSKSINDAYELIEDTLSCFKFFDYAVMTTISPSKYELWYDIVVAPEQGLTYVSFKVMFAVMP